MAVEKKRGRSGGSLGELTGEAALMNSPKGSMQTLFGLKEGTEQPKL